MQEESREIRQIRSYLANIDGIYTWTEEESPGTHSPKI